ncbi:hypothetical protein GA0070560_101516 [Micromonospora halophytica]|uniref:Uncharacterized protein n=1 Tax=Micromonospora halophytica TaxID=47864 RepID=A0A1C5GQZ5_9ACTN|nr:hypothetical protein GA0070560_101516 [Micromonospora halophytica]
MLDGNAMFPTSEARSGVADRDAGAVTGETAIQVESGIRAN